jgi:transposase
MRDLVRARYIAAKDVRHARAHVQMFLLKNGVRYDGKSWGHRHRVWLSDRRFDHAGQQIAFQSFLNRIEQAEARKSELEVQIAELCAAWSLGPIVTAIQALKGIGLVIAATLVAEIGDFSRFASPRHLMAWLGLVPGEYSSGGSIRPRGITKAGNTAARSLLFEAAWSYRTTPKVGQWQQQHRPEVPQAFKDIAWKAQLRLHGRYRKLVARGKRSNVAITAIARELVGFIWDIARRVAPTAT